MPSSYALRSVTSAETAFNKLTVSCWLKGHADGTQRSFWGIFDETSNNRFFHLYYSTNGSLYGYWKQNEGTFFTLGTTQKFRDPNAWFHFQMTMDTTLATASDRVKFYLNGERITSFEDSLDTASPFTQNATCNILGNTDGRMIWGAGKQSGTLYYWDRYMSHCHMCVGYAYDPTEFGSTDSVTGEWKINTSPSVLYGTNGGFWFKDSSALTDSSSNSNTLTVGGTLTNTEDNPSNVYCVFNPLIPQGLAYANGNLSATHNASSWKTAYGTIAMSGTGKYYFESKVSTLGSYQGVGIVDAEQISASASKFGAVSRGYGYKNDGSKTNNNSDASYGATYTTGDIIGCALDLTNGAIYFSKNGAWQNSATTSEIAAGTTTNAAYTSISSSYVYLPAVQIYGSGTNQFNAGNGFFGTTAVSSVQNPSSGDTSAEFEYTPPTGFQPITTKGLNE